MNLRSTIRGAVALLIFALTSLVVAQTTSLPRAVGPFKLGMTIEQFLKVSGKSPERLHDDPERSVAWLDADELQARREWQLPDISGVELLFLGRSPSSRLRHIAYTPVAKDFESTRKEFTAIYGTPEEAVGEYRASGPELLLEWRSGTQRLVISYYALTSGVLKLSHILIEDSNVR